MTRLKHVLILILLVLPMFALAPSMVAGTNELATNNIVVDTSLPSDFVDEKLRVAVYVEDNTTLPFYASGGTITNNYANIILFLENEGFDVIPISTQDILDHKLMAANFDSFVLVDQLPKDEIVDLVKDYWLAGGGILSFESSLGYLYYHGMIVSADTGNFGLLNIDGSPHWGYEVVSNFTIGARHSTATEYQQFDDIIFQENTTIHDMSYFNSANPGDFVPILRSVDDPTDSVGFALDNTARQGGRIVQLPGNCSTIPDWQESIITDSIDWLAPRPKARVAIDLTHVPFYGVDPWDENVTWAERYHIWRDTVVNHSSTFDKLYPTGNELTADDLAPFNVLIINMPSINYTAAEITVIRTWVQDGGGLYLLGDYPGSFLIEDQRLESIIYGLGITFYNGPSIPTADTSEFEDHPILEGVSSVRIAAGGYLNVSAPAYPIVYYGEPNVAMAGRDYGEGRILVVGDINGFDHSNIDNADNYQFSINVINWLSSATAKVLVYADNSGVSIHPNFVPLNGPVALALNDLEISFYMTSDKDYFNMSLFAEDWDMVILDNSNYNTRDYQPHLIDFVADGGKLIFSTYNLDATTGAYFGVQAYNSIVLAPPTVYLWEQDHPIFNLPAAYGETNLNSSLDLSFGTYAINFTTYANATPLAGYTAAHAGAAIVIGAGGNVIVNGPLLTVYNEDTDDSTYADNQEIWENEIAFLYFDRPSIDHPADVTYMETETGNEISWIATADAGAWEYVFSANGTPVQEGYWTGGALTFNVDGVTESITEYELTVSDKLGYSVSDLVSLNVTEYVATITTTTTNTTATGAPLDPTLLLIIGGAVVGVVIIIIIMMQLKKKKK